MPNADFVLNPKQENCSYKFDKICGATVAYKFIECLYEEFRMEEPYMDEIEIFDKLSAIATPQFALTFADVPICKLVENAAKPIDKPKTATNKITITKILEFLPFSIK